MNIIVVDDEETIRLGIAKILSKSEMKLQVIGCYGNGLEALNEIDKLKEDELDLLITDIKMPRMDGLKLIEKVRTKMPQLHIVVLSGFNEFEYARQALRFGVDDYLLKPLDKVDLFEVLRKIEGKELNSDIPMVMDKQRDSSVYHVIEQVKQIIEREYDKSFEMEKLAERVGLSASHLSKLFKSATGNTITDFLTHVRIEKAKQFLEDYPNMKNGEISYTVGYPDPVYFNKLFKKVVGVTPKEFKNLPK